MIGHWLLHLDAASENAILTRKMERGCSPGGSPGTGEYIHSNGTQCLVGTAGKIRWSSRFQEDEYRRATEECYDALCIRFGEARINNAIRDRILTNRLWRARSPSEAFAVLHSPHFVEQEA